MLSGNNSLKAISLSDPPSPTFVYHPSPIGNRLVKDRMLVTRYCPDSHIVLCLPHRFFPFYSSLVTIWAYLTVCLFVATQGEEIHSSPLVTFCKITWRIDTVSTLTEL